LSEEKIERVLQVFVKVADALESLGVLGKDIKQLIGEIIGVSETKQAQATAAPPNIFPKDLADMLSFEATPDGWKIKPRQYLGSENFAKIAVIVKEHGGSYVSEGKTSHFRLPKTAREQTKL